MILARTRAELSSALDGIRAGSGSPAEPGSLALVPTMGALHEGHLSLFDLAARSADAVAASIFVNPLQFDRGTDLMAYPRDLDRDLELAEARGVALVFAPDVAAVYPDGEPVVTVEPGPLGDRMEGAFRPGHFRGVLTVVAKLFHLIAPDVAVFGAKDFQQAALVRRMVMDLDVPVEIVVGETVREDDGLAMSSRNVRLDPHQRVAATALSRALGEGVRAADEGERRASAVLARMREVLRVQAGVETEYLEVFDPRTLEPVDPIAPGTVAAVAAHVGPVRLIDNMVLWRG